MNAMPLQFRVARLTYDSWEALQGATGLGPSRKTCCRTSISRRTRPAPRKHPKFHGRRRNPCASQRARFARPTDEPIAFLCQAKRSGRHSAHCDYNGPEQDGASGVSGFHRNPGGQQLPQRPPKMPFLASPVLKRPNLRGAPQRNGPRIEWRASGRWRAEPAARAARRGVAPAPPEREVLLSGPERSLPCKPIAAVGDRAPPR